MIDAPNRDHTEQALACLNCIVQISALKGFKCNPILREIGGSIRAEFAASAMRICDLLITLAPDVDVEGVATLNFTIDQPDFQLGPELDEPVERGHLKIKLRALGKPDHLHAAVTRAMNHTWTVFPNIFARLEQMEHFPAPSASLEPKIAIR